MRCLTLASALRDVGADCHFLCRDLPGQLTELLQERGYNSHLLPGPAEFEDDGTTPHSGWLSVSQARDTQECRAVLAPIGPDWLVVDHYALDVRWERALRPLTRKLMAIDDLADRTHHCDLLLDQNLGRAPSDYAGLLPEGTNALLGPQYALLRPEFAKLRAASLSRRTKPKLGRVFVAMGGMDKENSTAQVLDALDDTTLPDDSKITVVMGRHAPWLGEIRARAARMRHATEVLVDVRHMAQLMVESDLAIGAGGTTTWERCSLGLPSVQVALADNQIDITAAVARAGAAIFSEVSDLVSALAVVTEQEGLPERFTEMSRNAADITDGNGTMRVVEALVANNA